MTYSNETYKHGGHPVERHEPADEILPISHETPDGRPSWAVTRLLETYRVRGWTATEAYHEAALAADSISMEEFFSVPVYAVKIDTDKEPNHEQPST